MALAYRRDAGSNEAHIPATDARVHFGELLQHVTGTSETVVIERNGREIAAIVPIETYRRQQTSRPDDWRAELRAVQDEFQRMLDPTVPVNAADLIREGHEVSDAWMDDALS